MSWNRTQHRRSLALTTTYLPDAVCQFTYPGSTIIDNLSVDAGIDKRIGKASSTIARLTARVWTSPKLSMNTKMAVYNKKICVVSTLLNGSETWTRYAGQERRLNTFHLRSNSTFQLTVKFNFLPQLFYFYFIASILDIYSSH